MSAPEPRAVRVAICVPSGDLVHADFCLSLVFALTGDHLLEFEQGGEQHVVELQFELLNFRSSVLPSSRSTLVRLALAASADYVLFVDSDMNFPGNTFEGLIRASLSSGVPIVAVNAPTRREGRIVRGIAEYKGVQLPPEATGLLPADRIGFGIVAIAADVFLALPEPWFAVPFRPASGQFTPEDLFFAEKALAHGFRIAVDADLSREIGHVGSLAYTLNEAADLAKVSTISRGRVEQLLKDPLDRPTAPLSPGNEFDHKAACEALREKYGK